MGAGATPGGSEDDRRHCPFIVPFLVASRMLASRPSARRARLQPSSTCTASSRFDRRATRTPTLHASTAVASMSDSSVSLVVVASDHAVGDDTSAMPRDDPPSHCHMLGGRGSEPSPDAATEAFSHPSIPHSIVTDDPALSDLFARRQSRVETG